MDNLYLFFLLGSIVLTAECPLGNVVEDGPHHLAAVLPQHLLAEVLQLAEVPAHDLLHALLAQQPRQVPTHQLLHPLLAQVLRVGGSQLEIHIPNIVRGTSTSTLAHHHMSVLGQMFRCLLTTAHSELRAGINT